MAESLDVIVGAALMDNLIYADGSERADIPGGAGLHALAGAALFSDQALLVTGTGRDLSQTFGPWLERNRLSRRGLRLSEAHAPRNILRYIDETSRTETPVFGEDHFRRIEPTADDVAGVIEEARSLYIFRNVDPTFWRGINRLLADRPVTVLWEIALDACAPEHRTKIETLLATVDAFSLNRKEATLIYGDLDDDALLAMLQTLPVSIVLLRDGSRGSFAVTKDRIDFVPSLATKPVDVTGGGNAYGGGALIGLAEGRSPVIAAAMGTVAASLAISQYGPPEPGNDQVRRRAIQAVERLVESVEEPAPS